MIDSTVLIVQQIKKRLSLMYHCQVYIHFTADCAFLIIKRTFLQSSGDISHDVDIVKLRKQEFLACRKLIRWRAHLVNLLTATFRLKFNAFY